MFIREKKNKSGSSSVQIISKSAGRYKVVKTIGSSSSQDGILLLLHQARHELSITKAAELTQNMYQLSVILPGSAKKQSILLKLDDDQNELIKIMAKNF